MPDLHGIFSFYVVYQHAASYVFQFQRVNFQRRKHVLEHAFHQLHLTPFTGETVHDQQRLMGEQLREYCWAFLNRSNVPANSKLTFLLVYNQLTRNVELWGLLIDLTNDENVTELRDRKNQFNISTLFQY